MDNNPKFKVGEVVILGDSAGKAFAGKSATIVCHNWLHNNRYWDYGVRTSKMYREEIIGFDLIDIEAIDS